MKDFKTTETVSAACRLLKRLSFKHLLLFKKKEDDPVETRAWRAEPRDPKGYS